MPPPSSHDNHPAGHHTNLGCSTIPINCPVPIDIYSNAIELGLKAACMDAVTVYDAKALDLTKTKVRNDSQLFLRGQAKMSAAVEKFETAYYDASAKYFEYKANGVNDVEYEKNLNIFLTEYESAKKTYNDSWDEYFIQGATGASIVDGGRYAGGIWARGNQGNASESGSEHIAGDGSGLTFDASRVTRYMADYLDVCTNASFDNALAPLKCIIEAVDKSPCAINFVVQPFQKNEDVVDKMIKLAAPNNLYQFEEMRTITSSTSYGDVVTQIKAMIHVASDGEAETLAAALRVLEPGPGAGSGQGQPNN